MDWPFSAFVIATEDLRRWCIVYWCYIYDVRGGNEREGEVKRSEQQGETVLPLCRSLRRSCRSRPPVYRFFLLSYLLLPRQITAQGHNLSRCMIPSNSVARYYDGGDGARGCFVSARSYSLSRGLCVRIPASYRSQHPVLYRSHQHIVQLYVRS